MSYYSLGSRVALLEHRKACPRLAALTLLTFFPLSPAFPHAPQRALTFGGSGNDSSDHERWTPPAEHLVVGQPLSPPTFPSLTGSKPSPRTGCLSTDDGLPGSRVEPQAHSTDRTSPRRWLLTGQCVHPLCVRGTSRKSTAGRPRSLCGTSSPSFCKPSLPWN